MAGVGGYSGTASSSVKQQTEASEQEDQGWWVL